MAQHEYQEYGTGAVGASGNHSNHNIHQPHWNPTQNAAPPLNLGHSMGGSSNPINKTYLPQQASGGYHSSKEQH